MCDPVSIGLTIAGVGAAASGVASGVGASNAADAQKESAQKAMDLQREIFQQQRADQAPWLEAGRTSLGDLLKMTQPGYDASSLASDPGYQFRMAEGQKALERSASARGMLNSGGALKSLTRYSQGVASDEFGNRFNRLASIAGVGQASAQNVGAMGGQYANNMGNLYGAMGNANAAGAMGTANAIGGGFNALGNMAMMYGMYNGMGGMGGGGGGIPTQSTAGSLGGPSYYGSYGGGSGYGGSSTGRNYYGGP